MRRRNFIRATALAGLSASALRATGHITFSDEPYSGQPIILSTWNFGEAVPRTAVEVLQKGGSLIDAVEQAVRIPEADPAITSVGFGGFPDREGKVTLDACIMDGNGNCGSVVFLEHIMHPVSVARAVMEKTQHVMLAGEGALAFAREHGFIREDLLTENARNAYESWLTSSGYQPVRVDREHHDTIGLLAMDGNGSLAGGCSSSGMAWKIRGRVGDSPLIGAGLYVDNEVGAATATGIGEAVIKICGSFLIVELMRQGIEPQEACKQALERIVRKQPQYAKVPDFLVGFVALRKDGAIGACSYRKGLQYSLYKHGTYTVIDAESIVQ